MYLKKSETKFTKKALKTNSRNIDATSDVFQQFNYLSGIFKTIPSHRINYFLKN